MGAGALVGGALVAKGLKDSIKAAMDAQAVQAQTMAVLKSTGGAAGVTAKQIEKLSTQISQYSGIDDEAIQSTENLLLTFRQIHNQAGKNNDIFNQATVAAVDMSVALKQDLKSSAIQLGKALGDPVRGMTALRRVGVTFNDAQAETIKKLVASGHMLKAQKLILAEVRKEFGGSAKAAGKTFGGQLALLRVNVENLEERIGKLLLPVLTRWVRSINRWLAQARNQRKVIHDIRVAVRIMVGAFRVAAKTVAAFIDVGRLLVRWYRVFMRVNARVEGAFKSVWVGMKKQVMSFYIWIQKMGFKVALALVEPFSHLPKRLGGGTFQKIKRDLQKQLNDIEGVGTVQAKRNKRGQVRSPVVGGIRGAGGELRAPGAPAPPQRGGGRGPRSQEVVVHTHVHVDGREVAKVTKKHNERKARQTLRPRSA